MTFPEHGSRMQVASHPLPLTPSEEAWAHAVARYADARLPAARSALAADALESFTAFLALWRKRFHLDDPRSSQFYRAVTHESRRALYQRFLGQCRSWEATMRIAGSPTDTLATPSPTSSQRRLRELAEREERARAFHQQLMAEVERRTQGTNLPWPVREAYGRLGVPPGAALEQVRTAYRELAMRHHPDKSGDGATMASLSQAYHHLLRYHRESGNG